MMDVTYPSQKVMVRCCALAGKINEIIGMSIHPGSVDPRAAPCVGPAGHGLCRVIVLRPPNRV